MMKLLPTKAHVSLHQLVSMVPPWPTFHKGLMEIFLQGCWLHKTLNMDPLTEFFLYLFRKLRSVFFLSIDLPFLFKLFSKPILQNWSFMKKRLSIN